MEAATKYRWKITKDHMEPDGSQYSAKGTEGPARLDPNVTDNPARFSMYDDDGVCYYEGMLYGDHDGFEPLDDFGTPNAGCTSIKVDGEWV
jgi:hypothetical protein